MLGTSGAPSRPGDAEGKAIARPSYGREQGCAFRLALAEHEHCHRRLLAKRLISRRRPYVHAAGDQLPVLGPFQSCDLPTRILISLDRPFIDKMRGRWQSRRAHVTCMTPLVPRLSRVDSRVDGHTDLSISISPMAVDHERRFLHPSRTPCPHRKSGRFDD